MFGLLGMSKTIRMRQLITPFPMTERGGIYVEKLWGWGREANGTIPETWPLMLPMNETFYLFYTGFTGDLSTRHLGLAKAEKTLGALGKVWGQPRFISWI